MRYNEGMPKVIASQVEVQVFRRDFGRVLFLMVNPDPHSQDRNIWLSILGMCRENETCPAAALRILKETTGLEATGLWTLDYVRSSYEPVTDSLSWTPVFAAEVASETLVLNEAYAGARWVTFDQAEQSLRLPGQREALRRAHTEIVTAPDRGAALRLNTNA